MDVISSMIYETNFRARVVTKIERYVKAQVHCWLDKENDRFVVRFTDIHNREWTYEEYGLSDKLYSGVSADSIAHNAIIAYGKKIFREFFK